MKNELQIFNNPEFGEIRTINVDGKTYFVGSDVAKALGYSKARNAINQHCKGALKRGILTEGGEQEMLIISDGDVCRLIANSQLPAAVKFESWVFDEVLPSILKHGGYISNEITYEQLHELISDIVSQTLKTDLNALSQWIDPKLKRIEKNASAAKYFASRDSFISHESKWVSRISPKLKLLAKKIDADELKVLRMLYRDIETMYDINLNDYIAEWRLINGTKEKCSTLTMISSVKELRGYFESALNSAMVLLGLGTEEETQNSSFSQYISYD